eukprot:4528842-Pyramimonas_sp.AAC.1
MGSHWCQHRLSEHNPELAPECLVRGERGTLFHRHFQCQARSAWRRDNLPACVRSAQPGEFRLAVSSCKSGFPEESFLTRASFWPGNPGILPR